MYKRISIIFNHRRVIRRWKTVDEAVDIAHSAVFANMGQNCCSASRTFVQEGIYDKFVEKATKLASGRKVGDQFDPDTQIWPLVSLKRFVYFLRRVLYLI